MIFLKNKNFLKNPIKRINLYISLHYLYLVKMVHEVRTRADFETYHPAFIRDMLKAINTTGEEVDFEIDPYGISTTIMDPSHVAMIEAKIPYSFFDRFDVLEETKFTVNIAEILKLVFKKSVKDALLKVQLEEDRILFELRDGITRRKYARLLESYEEEIPEPKIFFNAKIRIMTDALKRIVEDIQVSEHIQIETTADKVKFSAVGDLGREEVTLERYDDPILNLDAEGAQKATYTLDYLRDFIKSLKPLAEVVTLEYSEDMPIKIEVELPIPDARLVYYLAPCIGATDYDPFERAQAAEEPETAEESAVEEAQIEETPVIETPVEEAPVIEVSTPIEEVPVIEAQVEEIDALTLRDARVKFYLDNPGQYDTPTTEQLKQYL